MSLPPVAVSQSPQERFKEYLESRPVPKRFTARQRKLLDHIFARHSHFDTDQLLADLQKAGRDVSRATVYRTLLELANAGLLKKIEIGSRTVYDHDYGYPQHEHLVCDRCDAMIEFQHPAIDAAVREITATHKFRAEGHTLVVRGTCAACNAASAARRRPYAIA